MKKSTQPAETAEKDRALKLKLRPGKANDWTSQREMGQFRERLDRALADSWNIFDHQVTNGNWSSGN